ncbi:MAG: CapA family protein [Gemmatimonadales bacterium]
MRIRHAPSAVLVVTLVASASAQGASRRDVRLCAAGDVSLGTNLDTSWVIGRPRSTPRLEALPDPGVLLAPLRPLVSGADVVLLNVEGAIGSGPAPEKCARRSTLCYAIRQPPAAALALRHLSDSSAVVGNVANNHAHDAGDAGFRETLQRLRASGVLVTGADTLATPVVIADGDTLGVLGFSPWSVARVQDLEAVRRHVRRAVGRYGRVVVTMHIGAEGATARHTVDAEERFAGEDRGNSVAFARAAVEGGASLVVGHGPHVLRAIEWSGRALVAYSLGNLVTYGPFNVTGPNAHGAILCATLGADGALREAEVRSTVQRVAGLVEADSANRAVQDLTELGRADFPKTAAQISPRGTVSPRP